MLCVDHKQMVTKDKLVEFGKEIGVKISGEYDINSETERFIEDGDEAMCIINRADASMTTRSDEFYSSGRPIPFNTFEYVSTSYDKWKETNCYKDFNDILIEFLSADIVFNYDVIIIDEAQDLSRTQWCVIDKLKKHVQHVIVAGDNDQSLFTWGGADHNGMRNAAVANDAKHYVLPQSYRIPETVHNIALSIRNRIEDKEVITYKPRQATGCVSYYVSADELVFDDADTLILYRTHSLRREIERHLIDTCTPYKTLNGYKDPWSGPYGRAIEAFNKVQAGVPLTVTQRKQLNRFSLRDTIGADDKWWNCLDIPDRFVDFLINTAGKKVTVRLSTIHGAKGKEADRVILFTGLTQRVVDSMTLDPDAEHRVFYVGVTRAKERLDIVQGDLCYDI